MPQSGERIGGRTTASGRLFVAILEFRDGKVWRDIRWFGDPLEVPAWRAQFTRIG
jgi:hypothetical protein